MQTLNRFFKFLLAFLLFVKFGYGQTSEEEYKSKLDSIPDWESSGNLQEDYKNLAGYYSQGAYGAVLLYDDGKCAIAEYATIVYGTYKIENNFILIEVEKEEPIVMYVANNPSVEKGVRVRFINFEQTDSYVQFDNESPIRVFNKNANCFTSEDLFIIKVDLKTIKITGANDTNPYESPKINVRQFVIPKGINELVITQNEKQIKTDYLMGVIKIYKGKIMIFFTPYFEGGLTKEEVEDKSEMRSFIDSIKENHERKNADNKETITEDGTIIHYQKLPAQLLENPPSNLDTITKSIFHRECE